MYRLFLDDLRDPPADGHEWVVVRSYREAVAHMTEHGCPSYMSFDHDLGEATPHEFDPPSGYDVAHWMVDRDLEHRGMWIPPDAQFHVHSQNPVGADNIRMLSARYMLLR